MSEANESPTEGAPETATDVESNGETLEPNGPASERRKARRYQVDGHAEVTVTAGATGTALMRGRILDISSTGCYIQTVAHVSIKPGNKVHIDFYIYRQAFRIDAICRFARTKIGIGFRFVEMDDVTWKRLMLVLTDLRSKLIEEPPSESAVPDQTA